MNKPSDARDIFCSVISRKFKYINFFFLFTSNKGVKKCPHSKAVKLNNLQNKIPHTTLGQCLVSISFTLLILWSYIASGEK